ncbi:MAG TPA: UvrB/UvrC motif-containing protein, partial [Steroidobacteraceae bacterium]|nr:UvrB/UvrC motif-containing protein [Steroidobacteraceae bacterium]
EKGVADIMEGARSQAPRPRGRPGAGAEPGAASGQVTAMRPEQIARQIRKLEAEMFRRARNLEFEEAARLRDQIERLKQAELGLPASRAG